MAAPDAASDRARHTAANANQAQPSPAHAQPQQPIQNYAEFQRNVPPAWPPQSATGGEPGFRGFWLGLTDSARGWLVIAVIAAAIVVVIVVLAQKPWQSQKYKDCVSQGQFAVNGAPGNTQAALEQYCHTLFG